MGIITTFFNSPSPLLLVSIPSTSKSSTSRNHFDITEIQRAFEKNYEGPEEKTPADWIIECIERLADIKVAADEIRKLAKSHPWLIADSKKIKTLVEAETEVDIEELSSFSSVSKTTIHEIDGNKHRLNNITGRRLLKALRKALQLLKAPKGKENQYLKAGLTWIRSETCPTCSGQLATRYNPENNTYFIGCNNWKKDGSGCPYCSIGTKPGTCSVVAPGNCFLICSLGRKAPACILV